MMLLGGSMVASAQIQTNAGVQYLQCMQKDMSTDFYDLSNTYFLADSLVSFDVAKGEGKVQWKRYRLSPRQAFNLNGYWPVRMQMLDFPDAAYENDPELKIKVEFITPRTVRVRMLSTPIEPKNSDQDDVMFCDGFKKKGSGAMWKAMQKDNTIAYSSDYGTIEIKKYPWRIVVKDAKGKILTQTRHNIDNDSSQVKLLPFSFIKRGSDNSRSMNPVLTLAPGERIYGCGESFTSLNKVGQKVHLSVTDPQGPETDGQYKPVPFFFSNRGYGVFMHTSAPVTCDFGASYIGADRLFMADEQMDFFIFLGEPKDILNEYTDITGKSPMLPLWSFGTWMSRITYFSQKEGLEIARQLRAHKIPSDVIHFDTGWFGVDWQCDYQFAKDRFEDPVKMLKQLSKDGFHTCLWQLPYFTPKNRFFSEIIDKVLYEHIGNGNDDRLNSGRQTDAQDTLQKSPVNSQLSEGETDRSSIPGCKDSDHQCRKTLCQCSCHSHTCNSHFDDHDKEGVKDNIQKSADHQYFKRCGRISFSSEASGDNVIKEQHRKRDQIDADIQDCLRHYRLRCIQKTQDTRGEKDSYRHQHNASDNSKSD